MRPDDRLFHDESLGKRHAGQGAELRVAALDQLLERGARQTCRHGVLSGRRELRDVTGERPPFRLVVLADVDRRTTAPPSR